MQIVATHPSNPRNCIATCHEPQSAAPLPDRHYVHRHTIFPTAGRRPQPAIFFRPSRHNSARSSRVGARRPGRSSAKRGQRPQQPVKKFTKIVKRREVRSSRHGRLTARDALRAPQALQSIGTCKGEAPVQWVLITTLPVVIKRLKPKLAQSGLGPGPVGLWFNFWTCPEVVHKSTG